MIVKRDPSFPEDTALTTLADQFRSFARAGVVSVNSRKLSAMGIKMSTDENTTATILRCFRDGEIMQ